MKIHRMILLTVVFATALSITALLFAADFKTSFKSESQGGIYTSWDSSWQFSKPGTGTFFFTAKAENDIHIAMSDSAQTNVPMYEIVIGGWGNSQSVIRRQSQGEVLESSEKTIKDVKKEGKYWVSINAQKSTIAVGYGTAAGKDIILEWQDPEFLAASKYFALSSWDTVIAYSDISLSPANKK